MTDHREPIARVSRDVGAVYAACHRLDGSVAFALNDADVVPIASMYKVLLALEIADAFVRGDLAPGTPCRVSAAEHSPGGQGLNRFSHPVTVSMADLLYLSLAWSDNTASDLLLARVSLDALHARAERLGLETVRVVGGCRTLLANAGEDFGYPSEAAAVDADWAPRTDADDLVLARTTRGSTADLARLGRLIALERAAHPGACRLVRDLMRRQVWTSRFASSFRTPAWHLASKTGTLSPWRGEFGLLTRNDGAQLAIAVVMRQHHVDTPSDLVDRAVAEVAKSLAELALDEGRAA